MKARLALDDLPWTATVPADDQVEEALEDLRELLALARQRKNEVVAYESLFENALMGEQTLIELLSRNIPRDLRVEMFQHLNKVRLFGDTEVAGFDVRQPSGNRHQAPTVFWAATRSWTVGCLTPRITGRSGEIEVELCDLPTLEEPRTVFFIDATIGVAELFRYAIVRERADLPQFEVLAPERK